MLPHQTAGTRSPHFHTGALTDLQPPLLLFGSEHEAEDLGFFFFSSRNFDVLAVVWAIAYLLVAVPSFPVPTAWEQHSHCPAAAL